MGAESPHSHGSGHRCRGEGSWRHGLGRGKGSWVRRERQRRHSMLRGARRAQAGAPTTTCLFPSESSAARPSPVRARTHTHTCVHTITCVHPNVWLHMVRFGVFKTRPILSLYNIYFLKKPSLVLWWRRWGSWRHPEGWHARHPHAHHGDKVRRVHGRRRRGGRGIHHAGGTRWRRRRRGRGPGRQRRLDPGGQGHHSGVALHLRGSWRSCGSRLLLLPWRDGPCASARGGSRRIWGGKEAQGHTRGGHTAALCGCCLGTGARGACFLAWHAVRWWGRAGRAVLVMGMEGWAGLPRGQPRDLWALCHQCPKGLKARSRHKNRSDVPPPSRRHHRTAHLT